MAKVTQAADTELKTNPDPDLTPTPEVEPTPDPDDPRRMVRIKLHKDKRLNKGLYVNVNNRNFYIPRGEMVEVPYYVAAVIENSVTQDEHTATLIESLTESANF